MGDLGGEGPSRARIAELAGGEPVLSITDLRAGYGKMEILHGVHLQIAAGRALCIIGPNGAGKSTVLHSIYGFTRIYGGMTCLQNMSISVPTAELGWQAMFRKSPPSDLRKAEELLHFVGLHAKRHLRARDLSFGQQKLLEFATVLMGRPKLVLLDEPTAGVNPVMIETMEHHIRELNRGGITFLVVEHEMSLVMRLCDPVIVLDHGTKLAQGTPSEVQADPLVLDAYLGA